MTPCGKARKKWLPLLRKQYPDHGIEVSLLSLRENHRSDIMAALLEAAGLFLGSPTIHRNLFPTVADFICYMRGLKPAGKTAAAFGSYGWSGESVDLINTALKEIGFDVIEPGVKALFAPDDADLTAAKNLAEEMIKKTSLRSWQPVAQCCIIRKKKTAYCQPSFFCTNFRATLQ